jgi:hypothetical protein
LRFARVTAPSHFGAAENMPLDNALDTGRQLNELIERSGGFARAGRKLQGI